MAKDDYKTTGGALKLKGVKDASIDKRKKKKKKPKTETDNADFKAVNSVKSDEADNEKPDAGSDLLLEVGKTEAERTYEEMRRRRLSDRLAREGVKTHKERVEELNKYLSTLSEHHDMPRIGPG